MAHATPARFHPERARTGGLARLVWGAALFFALCTGPTWAASEDTSRWSPSIGLSFDVHSQRLRGSLESGMVRGDPLPAGCERANGSNTPDRLCPRAPSRAPEPQIGENRSGNDALVSPFVSVSFELMAPRLTRALGEPRLFVHADLGVSFGFERNLAGEGRPERFSEPPFLPPTLPIPEIGVVGQGSRALAQLDDLTVAAGIGTAFILPLFDRPIRLKPSIEYLNERLEIRGVTRRAVAYRDRAQSLADFRYIVLEDESSITYHGLGLGMEVEVDTARFGPIQTAVFLSSRGYRWLGRLKKTLRDRNEFGEKASWTFETEPWAWRAGAGMRFRWSPKASESLTGSRH